MWTLQNRKIEKTNLVALNESIAFFQMGMLIDTHANSNNNIIIINCLQIRFHSLQKLLHLQTNEITLRERRGTMQPVFRRLSAQHGSR